jgi:hypothetical protein
VKFSDTAIRQISIYRTSPETKFGERSSDAVQAYARVRGVNGKWRVLPSPEFSLNARIPTLPNCVQEGDFNLASSALKICTTSLRVCTTSLRAGAESLLSERWDVQNIPGGVREEAAV